MFVPGVVALSIATVAGAEDLPACGQMVCETKPVCHIEVFPCGEEPDGTVFSALKKSVSSRPNAILSRLASASPSTHRTCPTSLSRIFLSQIFLMRQTSPPCE